MSSRRITIMYNPAAPPGQRFQYLDTTVAPPAHVWTCSARRKAIVRWICFSHAFRIDFVDEQVHEAKTKSPLSQDRYFSAAAGSMHHCEDKVLSAASGVYPYTVRILQGDQVIDEDDPEILIDEGGTSFAKIAVGVAGVSAAVMICKLLTCKKEPARG